jgi:tetratricopeptide (TPR) repeat protein
VASSFLCGLCVLAVVAGDAVAAESRAAVREARACYAAPPGEAGLEPCRRALTMDLSPERRSVVEGTLAARLGRLDRWDEVVEVYREGARRRPEDGIARLRLGTALLHAGAKPAEAEVELRHARRLRPQDADAAGQLALALAAQGRGAEAVAAFDEATRLDPGYLDQRPAARAALEAARRGAPWPPPPSS